MIFFEPNNSDTLVNTLVESLDIFQNGGTSSIIPESKKTETFSDFNLADIDDFTSRLINTLGSNPSPSKLNFFSDVFRNLRDTLRPQNNDDIAQDAPGFVFVQTNDEDQNQIVVYRRDNDGTLTFNGKVATGGRGSGGLIDPLQSQGSVIVSDDQRFLYTVNAASGTISSFAISPSSRSGLRLIDIDASGGAFPNSIAVDDDLLYVVNASGNRSITGFEILANGKLQEIEDSTRSVNGNTFDVGASTIDFSADGQFLLISERLTNQFSVYEVEDDGTTEILAPSPSSGDSPFGFQFSPEGFLVSAEFTEGTISSYSIDEDGLLTPITSSLPTPGTSSCWIVMTDIITEGGRIGVSSSTLNNTLFSFLISPSGELSVVDSVSPGEGTLPLDIVVAPNTPYVYSVNVLESSVSAYRVEENGELTFLETISEGLEGLGNNGLGGIAAI